MTPTELQNILAQHSLWVMDSMQGQRADLQRADLQEVDLQGADLQEADLQEADLRWADLRWANLQGADLQEADLRWADLRWANLQGADLQRANLRWADLQGAGLQRADLQEVDLQGADLQEADLRWADLRWANLRWANLRWANLPSFVPVVKDIHRQLLAVIQQPDHLLKMDEWHTCETTHCRAGWVIVLAGEAGKSLEKELDTGTAAALIYAASDPTLEAIPDWMATNEEAMKDIVRLAEMPL